MSANAARTKDPEAARRAVLDAAERLFAERGFAGASLRDIAHAAGASQPLIQHHFGSKEGLYRAVLRRAVDDYAARFPDAARVADEPVDIEAEVARLFEFTRAYPRLMRIAAWARLEGRDGPAAAWDALRSALVARIVRGQELGLVRNDIDAPSLAVMLESVVSQGAERRAGDAPAVGDAEAYAHKVVALLERGFAPGGTGRSARERRGVG